MNDIILPNNHITLTKHSDIHTIVEPILGKYNITHFMFARLYNDGTRFTLTNRPAWFEHFIKKGYFNFSRLDRHANCYESSYFLWDAWNKDGPAYQIVMKDAEQYFDIGRGFSILKKEKDWINKYDFSGCFNNYAINNFYLHNIDLLENFIVYFNERATDLINLAALQRDKLPYQVDVSREYADTFLPVNIIAAITNNLSIKECPAKSCFTKRELESIYWLLNGKSIPEIALIFDRSHRTVEKFISNIKAKLECHTIFQMGNKINDLGLDKLLKFAPEYWSKF